MKKISLVLLVILMSSLFHSAVFAQEFKGKVLLAPGFGYNSNSNYTKVDSDKQDGNSYRTFNLVLPIGYFVSNRVALALVPGYSSTNNTYRNVNSGDEEFGTKTNTYGLSFIGRHYTNLTGKLNFFGEAGLGYSWGKRNERWPQYGATPTIEEADYKLSAFMFGLSPGLNFSLTDCMSVEATIGSLLYTNTKSKDENASDDGPADHTNSFSFSYNSFSFGILFLF